MNVQERMRLILDSYTIDANGPQVGVRLQGNQVHVYGDVKLASGPREIPVQIDMVHGDFWCESDITSLHNSPTVVTGMYNIRKVTQLANMVGGPRAVDYFSIMEGEIASLEGLPQRINGEGGLSLPYVPNLGILRVLLVQNLQDFSMHEGATGEIDETLGNIMARYLRKGWAAMVPCARELIRAGFRENAKL